MELHDDGTITIALADGPRTTRVVTFGEYQKLRIASTGLSENLPENTDENPTANGDEFWRRCIVWWQEVFAMVADQPGPENIEDFPEWMGNTQAIIKALRHWRSVPLASGGKA